MVQHRPKKLHPATLVAQAGGLVDAVSGAVAPPIHPATTYARDASYAPRAYGTYSRDENPGYAPVERVLAELEKGADALLFASGMAAATAVFMALRPGDHVIAPAVMYHGLRSWLVEVARPWGLLVDFVPPGSVDALRDKMRPGETRLIWVETPANPTWEVTDIAAAAVVAHDGGALLAVDSTVATPVLSQPLTRGADLVMHSATKFLNGHSDTLAGALITARDDAMWRRIRALRHQSGAVLGPFECWLLSRGMRTLFLRVQKSCESAMALANFAAAHRKVAAVAYPGLPSDAGHAVARRQMEGGFGGVLSLRVAGGAKAALRVATSTRVFVPATSLGGVESLIEHRASIEGPDSPVPADLLRLSVGIENEADLIADLDQALAQA